MGSPSGRRGSRGRNRTFVLDVGGLVAEVAARAASVDRYVLGIAGPPGVGKSTVAALLAAELGAAVAPMDGFHRSNRELDRLGRRDRKGAPDTFDAESFVARLEEVVAGEHDVAWPGFDRSVDEPVDGAIEIPATAPLVVVEGNYLLLDEAPWARVVDLLDDVAHLVLDPEVRRRRLIERHVDHGRTRAAAVEFVLRSDERNAATVEAVRHRASILVDVDEPRGGRRRR